MDLENLRDSWRTYAPCNERSEADWERMTAQATAGKMRSSTQRLLRRWRVIIIVAAMLPFQLLPQLRGSGDSPTAFATTILLTLFIGSVLWRFFRLRDLLQKIDPATYSLRETCVAVIRLRRNFLHGVALNAVLAALLLGTLAFHQWQMNRPDWLYAFGIGLFIGIPIGINIFCRTLQDIEVLSNALRNVDEA